MKPYVITFMKGKHATNLVIWARTESLARKRFHRLFPAKFRIVQVKL